MNFFDRAADQNTWDWETLRQKAPYQTSLFQAVLNKDAAALDCFLDKVKSIHQEEINAALFAAHILSNSAAVQKIFPYATSAGMEAAKSCLIGSTYINDLNLFNETVSWLKQRGENALKKKDLRNHCLLNLSAFNHIDKVEELFKSSKSTLKNDSAVHDFCASILLPAAKYGSQELMELTFSIADKCFSNRGNFNVLVNKSLCVLAGIHPSDTGSAKVLNTPAHIKSFEWMINTLSPKMCLEVIYHSHYTKLDTDRLVAVFNRCEEDDLKRHMVALSQRSYIDFSTIDQAYEQYKNQRQRATLNAQMPSTPTKGSSPSRKM